MQISLKWLKNYLKIDKSTEEITDLLTFSGIEVEASYIYGDIPDSIITAKIVENILLDGSDHLQICKVDTGSEILQVVCGAPNCTSGIIGALAIPGTKLNDLIIKPIQIKGVSSSGMLCSEKELGLSDEHSGIVVLPESVPLGLSVKQFLDLPDQIFELEITPNRPDLLGYQGIANDLAASTGCKLDFPSTENIAVITDSSLLIEDYLSLENHEPELCPRYTARLIKDIDVKESPSWLKQRLIKSGLRPINNIVDITNYIMLETGHPLHAFDYDKLEGRSGKPEILIRRAAEKEEFLALDGNTYTLSNENLVIADGKKPIALAGVIGGLNSHITDSTVNVVLEVACFHNNSIRKTSYSHKISTDSSYRFERHLTPHTCEYASNRAIQLISEYAGGKFSHKLLDDWQKLNPKLIIPIRPKRFEQLIGIHLENEQFVQYLTRLGLKYLDGVANRQIEKEETSEAGEDALYFEIPPKRVDLLREIDLIEEVIRLHGMDMVPQKTAPQLIMDRHVFQIKRKAVDYLIFNGYQEVVNLSFTDPDYIFALNLSDGDKRLYQITLLNPQNSNLSVMRSSLVPQLLNTAAFNLNRNVKQIKIFELNKVFFENNNIPKFEPLRLSILVLGTNMDTSWKTKTANYDFYDLKGLVQDLLNSFNLRQLDYSNIVSGYFVDSEAQSIEVNNQRIAEYGKLKPNIASNFDIDTMELKQDVWIADIDINQVISLSRNSLPSYQAIPKYPSMERDISFLIEHGISHTKIIEGIKTASNGHISDVNLIDEYKGNQIKDGFHSLTYKIVFNNPQKTLTDVEVDSEFDLIVKKLKSLWDIQLR